MEPKDSKAQLEVWEWKEKAYEAVKHLPENKQAQALLDKAYETMEWLKNAKAEQKKVA